MNRIFNIIWSKTKEKWIVVSEHVKGNGKVPSSPLRSLAALTALFMGGVPAYAIDPGSLPTEGKITAGSGTIVTSGTRMTVNQSSQQMIANWSTFNIGENAGVRFNQPNSSAAALNRIFDQNPSQIMGSLSSNGQVFLLNPAGIIFGKTARVDVGGLVASSLNMLDSDFLAGKYTFTGTGSSGALLNQGVINTFNGGVVALMAPKVTNEGSITANSGSVLLAAGNQVSLDFTGDGLISYTVDQGAVDALVENKGLIKSDGGLVVMTARAADALHMATATNTGVIEAHTIQNKAGRILLLSDMANGQTNVGGTLDASAPNSGDGGFIETSAGRVRISDGTIVTTFAPKGKSGMWLIDPADFTIASDRIGTVTAGTPGTPAGDISGSTLTAALGAGSVTILSSQGSTLSGSGDINIDDAVSWSQNLLTLTAAHDININAVMSATGTASLTMNTATTNGLDSSIAAGTVKVGFNLDGTFKGRVDYSSSGALIINTHVYTVINDVVDADAANHLQGIALTGYYALGRSFSVSSIANFTPIGNSSEKFTGTFDGLGHTISAFTINRPDDSEIGLFGYSNGTIRNVGLVNASVTGNSYVGALVGYNHGSISNSYASGSVTGSGYDFGGLVGDNHGTISNSHAMDIVTGIGGDSRFAGGLAGGNYGTITNSYATGNVVADGNYAGGLVGIHHVGSITNSYATGSVEGGDFVGGLVGTNWGGSTITNSSATGNVEGTNNVGGLVGDNYSTITGSNARGSVNGTSNVGGLVGYNEYGIISHSYATGSVDGTNNVGGLVGHNELDAKITNSYITGNVTGNDNIGGLVGDNSGSITDSYATGSVTGSGNDVGGLVGHNESDAAIITSYATGNVEGSNYIGGLVGDNSGTITDSYATGSVTGSGNDVGGLVGLNASDAEIINSYATGNVEGTGHVGGLVGNSFASITDSYATGDVTGSGNNVGGLVGYHNGGTITNSFYNMTTSVIKVGNGEGGTLDAAVTPYGIYGNQFNDWLSSTGKAAKTLDITKYFDSSVDGYYLITNISADKGNLKNILGFVNDTNVKKFRLTTDLDLTGTGVWIPLFNAAELDGAGHKFTGLSINQPMNNDIGMIGLQGQNSTIKNLGVTGLGADNPDVIGYVYVGGLVGRNDRGTITNSFASINVYGDSSDNIGGLVGYNNGTITGSYATGSVEGKSNVGGLVGQNSASITDSYATGDVTGSGNNVGGLVGYHNGGTITNSFYNMTTSVIKVGDGEGGTLDAAVTPYGIYGNQFNDWLSSDKTLDITKYFNSSLDGYYLISNISADKGNLKNILGFVNDTNVKKFRLTTDLDLTGTGFWIPLFNAAELDGAGHKFTGLSINQPMNNKIGMIGLLGHDSTIKNLGVTGLGSGDLDVIGNEYVGGLVGRNDGGIITNSYATDNVSGLVVGGLVGLNAGTISNSYATGNVTEAKYGGGLVGLNAGTISNSYATGNVIGSGVGGLVGANIYGTVSNSYATGSVTGSSVTGSKYGTGLAGANDGGAIITNSYATDNVSGRFVGGLVGANLYGTVSNSYATGSVTGAKYGGGLVGLNAGTISNSYATGNVSGELAGGLVGRNEGVNNDAISNSYATGSVTDARYGGGLVGYNNGTITGSYATGNVSGYTVGGLVGYNIGSNHDTISNSYATGSVAGERHAGGLVGENDGSIFYNNYATGSVTGASDVGGLVGYNFGSIVNSYATGSVAGESNVGGLVGGNYGTIEKSYARGRVAGGSHVGALVGLNDVGATLSNSFYEKNANPMLTGVGDGTADVAGKVWGLSSASMKLLSNFMEATAANGNVNPGWDFTPGTGDWKIDAATNGGYPYLAWQTSEKFYERPVLSEPLPVTDLSYQGALIAPTGPLFPEGQLLEAKIVNPPSGSAPGLILVTVPQSLGSEGSVFSFVLPDEVKDSVGSVVESVTLLDGAPIPSWLHYNPETMTFTATDMLRGVTELKVLVTLGGKSWIVNITMQQAP